MGEQKPPKQGEQHGLRKSPEARGAETEAKVQAGSGGGAAGEEVQARPGPDHAP